MNVKTLKFVPLSELFDGFPELQRAFHESAGDFTMTWGTNDFTLVRPETFLDEIDDLNEDPTNATITPEHWASFVKRIEDLPEGTLIDLES